MTGYIVEFGRNRRLTKTLKDAVKIAYGWSEYGSEVDIYQIVKDKIHPVGTVVELRPNRYSGGKKKSIRVLFRRTLGDRFTSAHLVKSDGTVLPKIDILNPKYYDYFNHNYYFNDRMPKEKMIPEAIRESFYHRR